MKYDGSPSIVFGHHPKNGKFFVATKSAFNKNPKINHTEKDIERNHGQPNFIVMKLLGKNLSNRKKEMASNFTLDYVIDYLVKFIKFTYL
jgi:hypothetical protein